jgi:hypothetical protein
MESPLSVFSDSLKREKNTEFAFCGIAKIHMQGVLLCHA